MTDRKPMYDPDSPLPLAEQIARMVEEDFDSLIADAIRIWCGIEPAWPEHKGMSFERIVREQYVLDENGEFPPGPVRRKDDVE